MGRELIKNDSFLCEWIFKSVVIVVLMGGRRSRRRGRNGGGEGQEREEVGKQDGGCG